jgi:hypothetical protein
LRANCSFSWVFDDFGVKSVIAFSRFRHDFSDPAIRLRFRPLCISPLFLPPQRTFSLLGPKILKWHIVACVEINSMTLSQGGGDHEGTRLQGLLCATR